MEKLGTVFQVDSPEIRTLFKENPNYLVEITEPSVNGLPYCIIYFSSHHIYYPNIKEALYQQLISKNKYEWYSTRIKKGTKHIFIRDIQKQWYLNGINFEINSVEKLRDFLINETKGYRVIALGSSAGGYAAVLYGQLLNAEQIFSFNGQFLVSDLLETTTEQLNPIVFREQNNPSVNVYYSLRPFIKNPKSVFYFYSTKSSYDMLQFNHIKALEINYISFSTNHHGIPFLKIALNKVINCNYEDCIKMVGQHSPISFSIKKAGLIKCTVFLIRELVRLSKQKLMRK